MVGITAPGGADADVAAAVVGSGVVLALAALGTVARLGRADGAAAGCCWFIMHPPGQGCAARRAAPALPPVAARGAQSEAAAEADNAVLVAAHRAEAWVAAKGSPRSSARRETGGKPTVACGAM